MFIYLSSTCIILTNFETSQDKFELTPGTRFNAHDGYCKLGLVDPELKHGRRLIGARR